MGKKQKNKLDWITQDFAPLRRLAIHNINSDNGPLAPPPLCYSSQLLPFTSCTRFSGEVYWKATARSAQQNAGASGRKDLFVRWKQMGQQKSERRPAPRRGARRWWKESRRGGEKESHSSGLVWVLTPLSGLFVSVKRFFVSHSRDRTRRRCLSPSAFETIMYGFLPFELWGSYEGRIHRGQDALLRWTILFVNWRTICLVEVTRMQKI